MLTASHLTQNCLASVPWTHTHSLIKQWETAVEKERSTSKYKETQNAEKSGAQIPKPNWNSIRYVDDLSDVGHFVTQDLSQNGIKLVTKRLIRLIFYLYFTSDCRQVCYVGNAASECRLGLLQEADFAGDLKDSKSASGRMLCSLGKPHNCSNSRTCKHWSRRYLIGRRAKCGRNCCTQMMWHSYWCVENINTKKTIHLMPDKRSTDRIYWLFSKLTYPAMEHGHKRSQPVHDISLELIVWTWIVCLTRKTWVLESRSNMSTANSCYLYQKVFHSWKMDATNTIVHFHDSTYALSQPFFGVFICTERWQDVEPSCRTYHRKRYSN